jgi:hypothetical protein
MIFALLISQPLSRAVAIEYSLATWIFLFSKIFHTFSIKYSSGLFQISITISHHKFSCESFEILLMKFLLSESLNIYQKSDKLSEKNMSKNILIFLFTKFFNNFLYILN